MSQAEEPFGVVLQPAFGGDLVADCVSDCCVFPEWIKCRARLRRVHAPDSL